MPIALFLPFRNEQNVLFTVETVTERNGPIFAKQSLSQERLLYEKS